MRNTGEASESEAVSEVAERCRTRESRVFRLPKTVTERSDWTMENEFPRESRFGNFARQDRTPENPLRGMIPGRGFGPRVSARSEAKNGGMGGGFRPDV